VALVKETSLVKCGEATTVVMNVIVIIVSWYGLARHSTPDSSLINIAMGASI
jgi:hypothetical protein